MPDLTRGRDKPGRFVRVAGLAVERTSGPQPEGVDVRRLAPVLALLALMLLAPPASACTYPVGYEGPFDCDMTPRPRGTTTTTVAPTPASQATTTTASDAASEATKPDAASESTEPDAASQDTVPGVTVADTGEELPFTGASTTVTLVAAAVCMAVGVLAFFVARTKPKH
jgi:hypothetical protein